jgi:ABC-type amino acid transport substrate-binding protein
MPTPASPLRWLAPVVPALVAALLATPAAGTEANAAGAPATSAAGPALAGDRWSEVRRAGNGTIAVAYYYPLEGFAYRDESGRLTGLLIDVADQFRSYLRNTHHAEVTFRLVPYDDFTRFYDDVRHGRDGVIGLAGTTITEQRRKEVAFGPPYFANRQVLVTSAKVPELTRLDRMPVELAGFTALAFRGTLLEDRTRRLAESWPGLRIETMGSYQDIVRRLARDPKTFAFLDLNMFWVGRKGGAAIERHQAADGPREEFAFILPLGSDWVAPLEEFFALGGGYRQSRAYRLLMIRHLGVELRELLDAGSG